MQIVIGYQRLHVVTNVNNHWLSVSNVATNADSHRLFVSARIMKIVIGYQYLRVVTYASSH